MVRPPLALRLFYPDLLWRVNTTEPKLFLTFDDGPVPEVTPFVLDTLARWGVKATFFCVGENVQKHRQIFDRILAEGHAVGNHTYNHLKGWTTADEVYLDNVVKGKAATGSDLFRPPYGRVRKSQVKALAGLNRLVMWDVLSYDYDAMVAPEQCLKNVVNKVRTGSVIVFHDHVKAFKNLSYALPLALEHLLGLGWQFEVLDGSNIACK